MSSRIITIITLVSFVFYLYGCSTIEVVDLSKNQIDEYKDSEITSIVTYDNKVYEFDPKDIKPKPQIIDSLLTGWAISKQLSDSYILREVKVPVSEIKTLEIKESDVTNTLLLIGGVIGVLVAIFLLTFEINIQLDDVKWRGM